MKNMNFKQLKRRYSEPWNVIVATYPVSLGVDGGGGNLPV